MHRERLLQILREKSVRTGTFTLASGKTSDFYVDVRQTSLHGEGSVCIAHCILDLLRPDVVGVGGMTLGADPLTSSTVAIGQVGDRPLHGFLIRKRPKGHGVERLVVGLSNFEPGAKVAILEDTTTTGGSSLKAVVAAREAGLDGVQLITLVDREEGAAERIAEAGLELIAITTRSELLDSGAQGS